jgi:hypothetical protein
MSKKTKHPITEMAQRTFLDAMRITELEQALEAAILHIEGLMGSDADESVREDVAAFREVLEDDHWGDEE